MPVFNCSITWHHLLTVTGLRKSHANIKLPNVNLGFPIYSQSQSMSNVYRYEPHNDVSVNDGPHIRRCFHYIIILYYNTIVLQLPTVF